MKPTCVDLAQVDEDVRFELAFAREERLERTYQLVIGESLEAGRAQRGHRVLFL